MYTRYEHVLEWLHRKAMKSDNYDLFLDIAREALREMFAERKKPWIRAGDDHGPIPDEPFGIPD